MGKFRIFSGLELCKILEKHGFVQDRQKGSHIVMQKQTLDSTISVPIPNHREIRIGTLKSIIRQSNIAREFFEI